MEAVQYKCPACGAGLKFDAEKQDFKCEFCDSVFNEEDFFEKDNKLESEAETSANAEFENALLYVCPSCGAEVVTDETTAATTCYYCSNPIVLSGKLSGSLKPDYIIPFKMKKKDAINKFRELCAKKKFLPKDFISESRLEEIKGVYFPYWYVDCTANGSINAKSRHIRTWVVGDIKYTESTVKGHFRQGDMQIVNMPEAALKNKDRDILRYVCPFDGKDFVPFSMSYLSGFFAEKRDVEFSEIEEEINKKIRNLSSERLKNTINEANVSVTEGQINIGGKTSKYNLLPVWVLNYKHKDKNYIYALNAQTGKVYGELPVCKNKLIGLFAGVTCAVTALLSIVGVIL